MVRIDHRYKGQSITPDEYHTRIEQEKMRMERAQAKIDGYTNKTELQGATLVAPKPLFWRVNEPQYSSTSASHNYEIEPLDTLRWSVAQWLT